MIEVGLCQFIVRIIESHPEKGKCANFSYQYSLTSQETSCERNVGYFRPMSMEEYLLTQWKREKQVKYMSDSAPKFGPRKCAGSHIAGLPTLVVFNKLIHLFLVIGDSKDCYFEHNVSMYLISRMKAHAPLRSVVICAFCRRNSRGTISTTHAHAPTEWSCLLTSIAALKRKNPNM